MRTARSRSTTTDASSPSRAGFIPAQPRTSNRARKNWTSSTNASSAASNKQRAPLEEGDGLKRSKSTFVYHADSTDDDILERLNRAGNAPKFRALWAGDTSGHDGDDSAADAAMCCLIAYYTRDAAQVERIFNRGQLAHRAKWKLRQDYRHRTVANAIAFVSSSAKAGGPSRGQGNVNETQRDAEHLTDRGNAMRLARQHGRDLHYCHPWRKWLCWDGTRWRLDGTAAVPLRAKQMIAAMFREAVQQVQEIQKQLEGIAEGEPEVEGLKAKLNCAKSMMTWALKSESAKQINALLDLARSEPGIAVSPCELDRDPWLLNCANGTFSFRTGQLEPHARENLLTKLCPVAYRPDAPCPVWLKFLDAVFKQDKELITFIQRLLGRCLTGDVSEDILAILWGKGANGKTTLLNAVMNTLGSDYAMKARTELLMESRGERHPTEIADLFGRRFVAASETPDGGRLNESLIKDLTGRERLRGRRMREDFWEFAPTHKIVLLTNYKPRVAGNDEGIWRRLRLVPFEVTFWDPDKYPDPEAAGLSPELKQDKELDGKLQAEAEGILAWLVRGCLDWLGSGLTLPEKVRAATASYRAAEDTLGQFLTERHCDTGDRSARCKRSDLYGAYKAWSDARGKSPGEQAF